VTIWRTDDGDSISVATSAEPLVVLDTADGELWVCERCYLSALPASLTPAQVRDLHEQFAIEYRDLHRFTDAIRARLGVQRFSRHACRVGPRSRRA